MSIMSMKNNLLNGIMSQITEEFELEKDIELTILLENGTPIIPLITSLDWSTERKGACGVLNFEVLKEEIEFKK